MPQLTDYQKRWVLQQEGYDPEQYQLNEDNSITPKVKEQPALTETGTAFIPKVSPNPSNNTFGPTATGLASWAQAAPKAIAAGATGGRLALLAAKLPGPPLAKAGYGLAGFLTGAFLGGGAAEQAQSLLEEPIIKKAQEAQTFAEQAGAPGSKQIIALGKLLLKLRRSQQENPKSAIAGEIATIPLMGFNPSPTSAIKATRYGLPWLAGFRPPAAEIPNIVNVAAATALQPVVETGRTLASEGRLPTLPELGSSAALGFLFNRPNILGRTYGFHPTPTPPQALPGLEQTVPVNVPQVLTRPPDIGYTTPRIPSTPLEYLMTVAPAGEKTTIKSGSKGPIVPSWRLNKMLEFAGAKPIPERPGAEKVLPFKSAQESAIDILRATEQGQKPLPRPVGWEQAQQVETIPVEERARIVRQKAMQEAEAVKLEQDRQELQRAQQEFNRQKAAEQQSNIAAQALELQQGLTQGQIVRPEVVTAPKAVTPTGKEIFPDYTGVKEQAVAEAKVESPADLAARQEEARLAGEQPPKFSEEGKFPIGKEEPTKILNQEAPLGTDTPFEKGVIDLYNKLGRRANIPVWFDMFKKWGAEMRNIRLEADGSIVDANGNPVAGQALIRQGLQEVVAKINPKLLGAETIPHEMFHGFMNFLKQSPRASDIALTRRFESIVSKDPTYAEWRRARIAKGQNSSIEEFITTEQGAEFMRRNLNLEEETPFKTWYKDTAAYFKTRFTSGATLADFRRLLQYRFQNDAAFDNYFKTGRLSPLGGASATTRQSEEGKFALSPEETAKELGVGFKPVSAFNIGDMPPELIPTLKRIQDANGWEFTDPKSGLTFYTKVGASAEEIRSAYNRKFGKFSEESKFPELPESAFRNRAARTIFENETSKQFDAVVQQLPKEYREAVSNIGYHLMTHYKNYSSEKNLSETTRTLQKLLDPDEAIRSKAVDDLVKDKFFTVDAAPLIKKDMTRISDSIFSVENTTGDWRYFLNPLKRLELNQPESKFPSGEQPPSKEELEGLAKQFPEKKKLVNPNNDKVVSMIDMAVKGTDDASITPENATEIHQVLRDQVDWKRSPRIKEALNSKEFDPLDPEHWQTLNRFYNADIFEPIPEVKAPAPKAPKEKPAKTKKVAKENVPALTETLPKSEQPVAPEVEKSSFTELSKALSTKEEWDAVNKIQNKTDAAVMLTKLRGEFDNAIRNSVRTKDPALALRYDNRLRIIKMQAQILHDKWPDLWVNPEYRFSEQGKFRQLEDKDKTSLYTSKGRYKIHIRGPDEPYEIKSFDNLEDVVRFIERYNPNEYDKIKGGMYRPDTSYEYAFEGFDWPDILNPDQTFKPQFKDLPVDITWKHQNFDEQYGPDYAGFPEGWYGYLGGDKGYDYSFTIYKNRDGTYVGTGGQRNQLLKPTKPFKTFNEARDAIVEQYNTDYRKDFPRYPEIKVRKHIMSEETPSFYSEQGKFPIVNRPDDILTVENRIQDLYAKKFLSSIENKQYFRFLKHLERTYPKIKDSSIEFAITKYLPPAEGERLTKLIDKLVALTENLSTEGRAKEQAVSIGEGRTPEAFTISEKMRGNAIVEKAGSAAKEQFQNFIDSVQDQVELKLNRAVNPYDLAEMLFNENGHNTFRRIMGDLEGNEILAEFERNFGPGSGFKKADALAQMEYAPIARNQPEGKFFGEGSAPEAFTPERKEYGQGIVDMANELAGGTIRSFISEANRVIKNKTGSTVPEDILFNLFANKRSHNALRTLMGDLDAQAAIDEFAKTFGKGSRIAKMGELGIMEYSDITRNQPEGRFAVNPFRSEITKIAQLNSEDAPKVAKAFTDFYEQFRKYKGIIVNDGTYKLLKYVNPFNVKEVFTSNNKDLQTVVDYLFDLQDYGKSKIALTPKQQAIEKDVRDNLQLSLAEKNKFPTLEKTLSDPEYIPNMPSRKAINIFLNKQGTPEFNQLIKDWYDYYQNIRGESKVTADEALKVFKAGYSKRGTDIASQFGPIDKSAGIGLPRSWRESNLIELMSRFNNRYARRLAYEKAIKSQPEVLQALDDVITGLGQADPVRVVMEDITGNIEYQEAKRGAISGLVRALMLGPLTGVKDFETNLTLGFQHQDPSQVTQSALYSWKNMKQHISESFKAGVNRQNIASIEFGEGGIEDAVLFVRRLRDLINTVQGRNHLERWARATAFGQGKFLAMDNLWLAKKGRLHSQGKKFLDDFAPENWREYRDKGEFPTDVLEDISAKYVESVQGTYDYRGLPRLTQRGSLAPVLSLARWNVEKWNNFLKYNIEPLKKGNPVPFLMSTLGMFLSGSVVSATVTALTKRKNKAPSMSELETLSSEGEDVISPLTYKLAMLASLSGYAGIMGDVIRSALDYSYGKTRPQVYDNPLLIGFETIAQNSFDAIEALKNGEFNLGADLLSQVLEDMFQAYRLALPYVSVEKRSDIERANRLRDLKLFKITHDYPVAGSTRERANPFLNKDIKEFKKTKSISQAVGMLPDLIAKAVSNSNGDFEKLRRELLKIKQNSYQTFPSPDRDILQFKKYYDFLIRSQGKEAADKQLQDYILQNAINKEKSSLVPSL